MSCNPQLRSVERLPLRLQNHAAQNLCTVALLIRIIVAFLYVRHRSVE